MTRGRAAHLLDAVILPAPGRVRARGRARRLHLQPRVAADQPRLQLARCRAEAQLHAPGANARVPVSARAGGRAFARTVSRDGRTFLVPGVLHPVLFSILTQTIPITAQGAGTRLGAAVHAEPLGAAVQHQLLGAPRRGRDEPDRAQAGPRARRERQQRVRKRAAAAELGRVQPDLLRAGAGLGAGIPCSSSGMARPPCTRGPC